jgi:hypothetical protein
VKPKVVRASESLGLNDIVNAMEVGLGARNLDAQHQQSQEEDAAEWRRSHTAPTMAEEIVAHMRAAKKHPM